MTFTDPLDPRRPASGDAVVTETVTTRPGVTETVTTAGPAATRSVETVVVRESNTGWWIAGVLGALVLLAVLWILFARGNEPRTDTALIDAQMDAAAAQAQAEQALIAGQVAGAQASIDAARADAARAEADAARAEAEARAAAAEARTPVVVEREVDPASPAVPVVTPTAPQN